MQQTLSNTGTNRRYNLWAWHAWHAFCNGDKCILNRKYFARPRCVTVYSDTRHVDKSNKADILGCYQSTKAHGTFVATIFSSTAESRGTAFSFDDKSCMTPEPFKTFWPFLKNVNRSARSCCCSCLLLWYYDKTITALHTRRDKSLRSPPT